MEDGKQLIQEAFDQARATGRSDWYRMTTAVLKNRLLSITDNDFDETIYGATSFTGFLARYDDLVELDRASFPPVVVLRNNSGDDGPSHRLAHPVGRAKIRSDLWRAALDYSSGIQYVWDEETERVRPGRDEDDSPVIPTISQDIHQGWREEFSDDVQDQLSSDEQDNQLNTWIQHQLPTSHLPRHLIGQWNGFLRDKVLNYLMEWFNEAGLEPPSDLFATVAPERKPRGTPEAEDLRQFVTRVVREMNEGELSQLNLPARAVLRASRPQRW